MMRREGQQPKRQGRYSPGGYSWRRSEVNQPLTQVFRTAEATNGLHVLRAARERSERSARRLGGSVMYGKLSAMRLEMTLERSHL